ncbi:unnamed protein product [Hymenolepis diminuta]|uniref:Ubiquitin-like modifier-activating enzyme ATG7 n=1 Tax=Hymenolepis diminuta TaxID=6216 RepID=A0A0R3SB58_HYMDI|nr:unnamed protein product [Hymenolepis diminuta]VUZ56940.1 unnamed protein product [Hymenolepis diminuta]
MSDVYFVPFDSVVDTTFWHVLSKKKLEDYRLDEGPFPMFGQFTNGTPPGVSPRMSFDYASMNETEATPGGNLFNALGYVYVLNTVESFRQLDKKTHITNFGRKYICEVINVQHDFLLHPNKLLIFSLLTYCDLKNHKFYYWFAFPAVKQDKKPKLVTKTPIGKEFTESQMTSLLQSYDNWRKQSSDAFFCLNSMKYALEVTNLISLDLKNESQYIGYCDPSSHEDYPGWGLRNLLYALSTTVKEPRKLKVFCFRDRYTNQKRVISNSIILQIEIQPEILGREVTFVGWEKSNDKLQPCLANLRSSMDPVKLADSAVDLNLKLMLWRFLPYFDLDILHKTKCLILGSGTLGCNVARQLLAWGCRNITFVDNSTVSYSNPVRQTLFTFADAKNGVQKSIAAAEAIRRILPTVNASCYTLTIPMPGHSVSNASAGPDANDQIAIAREACQKLEELIKTHDVVFLLLDTREARWLPTLLSTYYNKIAITAALGFDTFLVMRHGVPTKQGVSPSFIEPSLKDSKSKVIEGSRLGCYFCNDVVGPANSTREQTLDQQCTVARPGVSMMASSLAVELCIGLLQHPQGPQAPAEPRVTAADRAVINQTHTFGFLPHQLRGFLPQFSEIVPCTTAFSKCSACSQLVLDAYAGEGFDFLLKVFDDPKYVEVICGLTALSMETNSDTVIALSDTDED